MKNIKSVRKEVNNIKQRCRVEIDKIIDIVGYDYEEFEEQKIENFNVINEIKVKEFNKSYLKILPFIPVNNIRKSNEQY